MGEDHGTSLDSLVDILNPLGHGLWVAQPGPAVELVDDLDTPGLTPLRYQRPDLIDPASLVHDLSLHPDLGGAIQDNGSSGCGLPP